MNNQEKKVQRFLIEEMDCSSCAAIIEAGVSRLEGVTHLETNVGTRVVQVTGMVDEALVRERVKQLGYTVLIEEEQLIEEADSLPWWRQIWGNSQYRLILIGFILILPAFILGELLQQERVWSNGLALLALLITGYPVVMQAGRELRFGRKIGINFLMSLAALGAVILGEYSEAGVVMVLFGLSEALESFTVAKARQSIREMMGDVPNRAVLADGRTVDVAQLAIGDQIVVKPGERIPMDGTVKGGRSAVNQAPITGESVPVAKEDGDAVFAGTINGTGVLDICVTGKASDNTISRLIQLVEEAQEKQAPAQRFVDRFAQYYTPVVVIVALLVGLVPPLFFNAPFWNTVAETGWFYRGLALLVIACPCALVIGTPVTVISGLTRAARQGVLIKGGVYLEQFGQIKQFLFDKTGTLTEGRPLVTKIFTSDCVTDCVVDCVHRDQLIGLAGELEAVSEHPLAQAVLMEATNRGVREMYGGATNVEALVGRGIRGEIGGRQITLGSHRYFDQAIPHDEAFCLQLQALEQWGETAVLVHDEANQLLGAVSTADQLRPECKQSLAQLRAAGAERFVMLTGDGRATAEYIGGKAGMDQIESELLPEQKLAWVERFAKDGQVVMVGDGINDAPALARADVGIAMGTGGTAEAMEAADIALLNDNLSLIPFAYQLSQKTMQLVWGNVILSLGIKFVFMSIILSGAGSMWLAVLADVGTTLLVVANGMRLLKMKIGDFGIE